MKWYVVNTYSGHENKAKLSLHDRVAQAGLDERFGEILVPTNTVTEMVKGQKVDDQKFFPGYMFVQMDLDKETLHLVKNTPKITGFWEGRTHSLCGRARSKKSQPLWMVGPLKRLPK